METEKLDTSKVCSLFDEVKNQIKLCEEKEKYWQEQKKFLQSELSGMMEKIKEELGLTSSKKSRNTHDVTNASLVSEFLAKNGRSKTSDIRDYLLSKGRTTNVGVILGRLVKDKKILNSERGVYEVCSTENVAV